LKRLSVLLIGIAIGTIGTVLALNLFFLDPKHMDEDPATVSADSPTFSAETQESSSAPRAQESATGAELSIETPKAVDEFSAPIGAVQNVESDIGKSAAPERKPNGYLSVPVSDAHKPFLGREDGGGRADTHTELENEPEDADWSYFMEQALSQFLSEHPTARLKTTIRDSWP
jgi:hypothetical protein